MLPVSSALCFKKARRHIHMLMQYTSDLYQMSITYFVENDMTAYRKSSIPSANVVAGFAKFVVFGQLLKSLIKFGQVLASVLLAPGLLSEFRNPFQVGLSRSLYSEVRH